MKIETALDDVVSIVNQWATPSDMSLGNGRQILNLPWLGVGSYLHRLFPSARKEAIDTIAIALQRQPLPEYRNLLSRFNGLQLFGTVDIFGVPGSFDRSPEVAIWQPFDLFRENLSVLKNIGPDDMRIGSAGPDGDALILLKTGVLERRAQDGTEILQRWNSLGEFLSTETRRLARYYGENGRRIETHSPSDNGIEPWPQTNYSRPSTA